MQTYVWYNRNVGEEAHTFTVIWLINSPLEALGRKRYRVHQAMP